MTSPWPAEYATTLMDMFKISHNKTQTVYTILTRCIIHISPFVIIVEVVKTFYIEGFGPHLTYVKSDNRL